MVGRIFSGRVRIWGRELSWKFEFGSINIEVVCMFCIFGIL